MTKKVYKYEFPIQDIITIGLPVGAMILAVQEDGKTGNPCIWCLVDPNESAIEQREFRLAGTGRPIEDADDHRYVGTFQMHRGELVFHLFEVRGRMMQSITVSGQEIRTLIERANKERK